MNALQKILLLAILNNRYNLQLHSTIMAVKSISTTASSTVQPMSSIIPMFSTMFDSSSVQMPNQFDKMLVNHPVGRNSISAIILMKLRTPIAFAGQSSFHLVIKKRNQKALTIPQKYFRLDESKMLTTRLLLATTVNPDDTVSSIFQIYYYCNTVSWGGISLLKYVSFVTRV